MAKKRQNPSRHIRTIAVTLVALCIMVPLWLVSSSSFAWTLSMFLMVCTIAGSHTYWGKAVAALGVAHFDAIVLTCGIVTGFTGYLVTARSRLAGLTAFRHLFLLLGIGCAVWFALAIRRGLANQRRGMTRYNRPRRIP